MKIVHAALLSVALVALPQSAVAADRCGCAPAFDDLIAAIERSYAGFGVAVNNESRRSYEAHTARLRVAAKAASAGECFDVLQMWTDYFADGHLQVSAGPGAAVSRMVFSQIPLDRLAAESSEQGARPRAPIEGIWRGPYGTIRVFRASQTMPYDFFAVATDEAEAGAAPLVATFKADPDRHSYRASWRGPDGAPLRLEVSTADGDALYAGFWGFRREDANEAEPDPLVPSLRMLREGTAVLRLPSMLPQYREPLEALLRANAGLLSRTPRLVLDLRGNMGGSDSTYEPLLPYVATGPIATVAGGILNSEDHVRYYERFVDRENPVNTMPWVTELLGKMATSDRGSLIPAEATLVSIPNLHPLPRQIAILIDGSNGSSAETFLLKAMQSDKVTILGRPTRGNVDYLNPNVLAIGCPEEELRVSVPAIRRSLALPADAINGTGISPVVRIPDEVANWVLFAAQHLERHDQAPANSVADPGA